MRSGLYINKYHIQARAEKLETDAGICLKIISKQLFLQKQKILAPKYVSAKSNEKAYTQPKT